MLGANVGTTLIVQALSFDAMGGIATDRLVSVAFGALLAWAAHSSVAVALLVMSFTEKGVVPLDAALALIVGANIGSALNPLFEGARGGDVAGWRVVVGNITTRIAGDMVERNAVGFAAKLIKRGGVLAQTTSRRSNRRSTPFAPTPDRPPRCS